MPFLGHIFRYDGKASRTLYVLEDASSDCEVLGKRMK